MGLVALDALADALERAPDLGARKALEAYADALPEIELARRIVERIERAHTAPDLGARAAGLLKLAGSRDPVRRAAAGALQRLLPEPRTADEKAALRAAKRWLAPKSAAPAPASDAP